jgi:hypothetical protein
VTVKSSTAVLGPYRLVSRCISIMKVTLVTRGGVVVLLEVSPAPVRLLLQE